MTTIASVNEVGNRFTTLKWANISVADVVTALNGANIPIEELLAYLDALIAAPAGVNDQTIVNCTPAHANAITSYFKGKGVITN